MRLIRMACYRPPDQHAFAVAPRLEDDAPRLRVAEADPSKEVAANDGREDTGSPHDVRAACDLVAVVQSCRQGFQGGLQLRIEVLGVVEDEEVIEDAPPRRMIEADNAIAGTSRRQSSLDSR